MKMRRPWQPHMGNDPLFNPFVPPQERERLVTMDHIEIAEEEEQEQEEGSVQGEASAEQKNDETPAG